MPNKIQLIYKLDDVNAEEGVNVFEITPILMSFGELIRSANDMLGFDQKINIKVKPFKEGSWITEFILDNQSVKDLLNHFHTSEGTDILILLQLLGLNIKESVVGVVNIIRFTKGRVGNFRKNNDKETVTYMNSKGEELIITLPEHKLVQSPLIQINYYNSIVSPLDKFPTAISVGIKVNQTGHTEQIFTEEDKKYFEEYANIELFEDMENNVT